MGIYISSNGEVKKTEEMNSFNLVNALIKASDVIALNPNGFGSDTEGYQVVVNNKLALKDEVLARLDTRTEEEKQK